MGTRDIFIDLAHVKKDHPHAYGDKFISIGVFCALIGSSPRVWGQAEVGTSRFIVFRIIPTRMGTRSCAHRLFPVVEDHPHAYGDKI